MKLFGNSNINRDYVIAEADRVPFSQKFGYGVGTFFDMWGHWLYPTIAFQIFGTFLHMPFWQIGVAVILNRIFDAVSDPVFGWLSDNARTRWGRRRPFMLAGTVLASVGLPFLLAVTPGWGNTTFDLGVKFDLWRWHVDLTHLEISHYFWFMLGSSAVYLPLVSCFNMPYQSLANELTPDYHERTSVFAVKNAIQKLPELALFFFGAFFTKAVWAGADSTNWSERVKQLFTTSAAWGKTPDGITPNMLLGGQVYLAFCGIILFVCGLTSVLLVKERYYGKLVANRTDKISIKETLWQTLKCKPFLIQKVMDMGYNMGLSMVGTLGLSITIYYVCNGNSSVGNDWNFWMGVSGMVLGFCGIPVFTFLARHLGKRHAMGCVLGLAILVFLGSWWLYTPEIVWLQVLASGTIAFIGAGYWTIAGSIGADVMDYDEYEGGRRREGSFAACGSWINKVGMAVGAGISFFILDWVGLDSSAVKQTDHTIFMIRFLFLAIPIVGLACSLFALSRFPLTQEKMAEIRAALEARRGKV